MKRFGIGYENYREFIEENLYYIDKTWLVRDVIEKGGKVILFTRPRRFGKTLALSMLQTFFELEYDYIATGHYAVCEYDEERGRWLLKRSADRSKDQTYVLKIGSPV